jgi:hypothetical protein
MRVAEIRARRKAAGERLLLAWALAIVPNTIAAFGVDLRDAWWWYVIRFGLGALWLAALVVWLAWLGRERQAKRALSTTAP